ncbi:MAG: prolyl oligopeptidase family serine peptidase [Gemmataceae bacterium]
MSRLLAPFLVCVATPFLSAQPERTHTVTPDDYQTIATVTELAVSPDGKQVAYCLATWDAKSDRRSTDVWVVDTDGKGKPQQITKDRAGDRHLRWSADGGSIYMLGNRRKDGQKEPPFNGSTQIWRVSVHELERDPGSELTAVTKVPGGITGYDYAPKARTLFYTVDAETTDADDFLKLREKFGSIEYGHGKRKVSELFKILEGSKAERVLAEKRYIREFAVTQDAKRIAMISAFDDSVLKSEGESRVDIWEGGKVVTPPTDVYRKKAASPWAWLESLAWNPDGTRFAFCAIFDGYPAEIVLGERKDDAWTTRYVKRGPIHIRGYGSPLAWSRDQLLGLIEDRGFVSPYTLLFRGVDLHAAAERVTLPPAVFYGYSVVHTEAGVVEAFTAGTPSRFADPGTFTGNPDNPIRTLLDLNSHTKTWKLPSVSHITWKAPDGVTVGGPLELPPGWKKGDPKLPLVVAIHGGPTTASHAALEFDPHNGRLYFSAAGYAVLCPNYRGSTGYGDKFVTDLIGRENDIEVKDILAGIQHLIDEGIVDKDRIGVMGWSNGGYLTNCLIALKDSPIKFKGASSGAGILDTVAEWGFNDEPAYPRVFKKGLPWETPDIYKKTSPTYQLGNVKTPTLIHVGGDDPRCPPGHSRMLYRALKEYVDVPTQLVVYPGEPHGLSKLSNRKAKMEWDLAWFDKYVKNAK